MRGQGARVADARSRGGRQGRFRGRVATAWRRPSTLVALVGCDGAGGMTTATGQREMTYLEAISDALRTEMRRDESVICIGEDIGAFGGAFKVTDGFVEEFGADRCLD